LRPGGKILQQLEKSQRSKRSTKFPNLLFVELRAASSSPYGVPLECL
jgi:hypothetical protein